MKNLNSNFQKLITLLKEAKEIKGRTKFQKIVYILKQKGIDFDEKFKYHFYGPYSPDLQLELEELIDRKLIVENSSNPFIYKLNNKIKNEIEKDNTISEYANLITFLNKQDYKLLELVSTIYFIETNISKNKEIIIKKANSLKPHLNYLMDKAFNLKNKIDKF